MVKPYPSEKYELFNWEHSQLNGKIKFMFQTTNQRFSLSSLTLSLVACFKFLSIFLEFARHDCILRDSTWQYFGIVGETKQLSSYNPPGSATENLPVFLFVCTQDSNGGFFGGPSFRDQNKGETLNVSDL